jgi:proteasome lid subunit RPN8/RPN11
MDAPAGPLSPVRAWIAPGAVATLLAAYRSAAGVEPCGVVAGRLDRDAARIASAIPLRNAHAMPDRAFLMTPEDLLGASRRAADGGGALLGFWHGHLQGGPYPGREDESEFLAFAAGPNAAWAKVLVVAGRGASGRPVLRAYARSRDVLREVPLRT